jgi:hypothetical protein
MKKETSTMSSIFRASGTLPLLAVLAAGLAPAHAEQLQVASSAPYRCAPVEGGNTANETPSSLTPVETPSPTVEL